MKADAITAKILEDANNSASEIKDDANERVQKIRIDNEKQLKLNVDLAMEQARRDSAELRDKMLRMAELDQRKELLAMKRDVINSAFDKALSLMRGTSVAKARAFMEGLLISACEGDETIIVSEGDEKVFDQTFVNVINAKLVKLNKKGSLTLSSETRKLGGGIMLSRGGMEVNLTYPSIINERRTDLESEVAYALFD